MVQKYKFKNGFTIVELLIVIIVIGILVGITVVSYAGITSRANTTKAATNASAVQKVIETFNADCGRYPGTLAEVTTSPAACFTSARMPAGITLTSASTTLTSGNGLTNVQYQFVGTVAAATGGRIKYFDFGTNATSTTFLYVGNATAGTTEGSFVNPS